MSWLVALKMEGRLAGAILTVLSRGRTCRREKEVEAIDVLVGYIFSGLRDGCKAELQEFGTHN